ncbi:uncharacterized protein [Porites lutea]|uniref:uncharacterized protein n=1 Tax=Porites lutea TaxID=51062 RepID=UPI003CC66181
MVEPDFPLSSDDKKDNPAEIPKQLLVAPEPVLTALETEVHVPLLTDKQQVPENPQPQFDNVSPPDGHNQETIAEGNTSTKAEDNKDEILRLLQKSFSDLTSVSDLQSFLFLYSRVRVMVSVEKLLELNGETCVTAVNTGDTTIVCGDKVSYNVTSCGSRVEIVWKCKKGHCKKWESSEVLVTKRSSNIYLNDSLQAAAIIISGNNYEKFSLLAKALNLNLISVSTFNRFQKHCAEPVVRNIWQKMNSLIQKILNHYDEICLCGDGRNDSPGHSARYCVYTLMEHATNVIVDFEVVDSRETGGNSVNMEREGLRRLLEKMASTMPFSDASSSIMKLVRETKDKYPQLLELFHSLDIWHKAKKLSKCLHQVGIRFFFSLDHANQITHLLY